MSGRILQLNGPGNGPRDQPVHGAAVSIGRYAPNRSNSDASIVFDDPSISRRHAMLRRDGNRWLIEDLGSANGTWIGSKDVRGLGAVELTPGNIVRMGMGDTRWTLLLPDWWHLQSADLLLISPMQPMIAYAEIHCGQPAFPPVKVFNCGNADSTPRIVRFTFGPEPRHQVEVQLPALAPGECREIAVPSTAALLEILDGVYSASRRPVHVCLDGAAIQYDLTMLGRWQWPRCSRARKTLAAYVSPHHSVVEQLMRAPRHLAGAASRRGENSSGPDAQRLLSAVYYAFAEYEIIWKEPPLGDAYQTIRSPHRMYSGGLSLAGSCLDLSLLAAACLANGGASPVIVLLGRDEDDPIHAVSGCWMGGLPGGRPVDGDTDRIRCLLERGQLKLVEWTALAAKSNSRPGFDAAAQNAADEVGEAPWCCLVDIGAIRGRGNSFEPIGDNSEISASPEVETAYAKAKEFARWRNAGKLESIDLLYGLFAAEGPIVCGACTDAGLTPAILCDELKARRTPGDRSSSLVLRATQGAWEIESRARELAYGKCTEERHLLAALLEQSPHSKSLRVWTEELSLKPEALKKRLPPCTTTPTESVDPLAARDSDEGGQAERPAPDPDDGRGAGQG